MEADNAERIETLAVLLEYQLSILYPDALQRGNIHDDDRSNTTPMIVNPTGTQQLKSCVREMVVREFSSDCAISTDVETFRIAFLKAVQQWKEKRLDAFKTSSEPNVVQEFELNSSYHNGTIGDGSGGGGSFSLLDQFIAGAVASGGVGGLELVKFEDIEQAACAKDRLLLFQKITYLEDLQMDWDQIRPILCRDMTVQRSLSALVDQNEQMHVAMSFMSLHQKWFDEGRRSSSGEYIPLMYGLCLNLTEALVAVISDADSYNGKEQTDHYTSILLHVVSALIQTWHEMWLDLMECDDYIDESATAIGVGMMLVISCGTVAHLAFYANQVMSLMDPCAGWFQSWVYRISPQEQSRLVQLLRETHLLSSSWARVQNSESTDRSPLSDTALRAVQVQALSILCICVGAIRLSSFPWDTLQYSTQGASEILRPWKKLERRIRVNNPTYHDNDITLPDLNSNVDEMMKVILGAFEGTGCRQFEGILFQGLDALLWGCRTMDLDFDRRWALAVGVLERKSDLGGDESGLRFLEKLKEDGITDLI
jgi:hypothetical protein